MTAILSVFGSIFVFLGIYYMVESQVLWGMLVLVIGSVYLFGFESVPSDERYHKMSHVLVGGILAGVSGAFLILEKILSLISEPSRLSYLDVVFISVSLVALILSMFISRRFG